MGRIGNLRWLFFFLCVAAVVSGRVRKSHDELESAGAGLATATGTALPVEKAVGGADVGGSGFRTKPVFEGEETVGMRVSFRGLTNHPLQQLGLKGRDIVLEFNGTVIDGPEALSKIYRTLRESPTLTFLVERDGKRVSVTTELDESEQAKLVDSLDNPTGLRPIRRL